MRTAPTRADARRSRRLLLEAGAAAFAECGIDVQVSEITRRAGLAKGTFFRHFPTKRALLVAILVESIQRHAAVARALLAEPSEDLIEQFLSTSAADIAPLRGVIEHAILCHVEDPALDQSIAELEDTLQQLLDLAQRRGQVRDDLVPTDLTVLLLAATNTSGHFFFRDSPELWRRYLTMILDGLRPAAAHPLPVAAPTRPSRRSDGPGAAAAPRTRA